MADLMPLPELVRDFLQQTRLPITELGRRAADPKTGKPMTPNTINNVQRGGRYELETELRLRKAIDEYATTAKAFSGQYTKEMREAADELAQDND